MSTLTIYIDDHTSVQVPITQALCRSTLDLVEMERRYGDEAYDLAPGDLYHELWLQPRTLIQDYVRGLLDRPDWQFDDHNDYLDLDWDLRQALAVA